VRVLRVGMKKNVSRESRTLSDQRSMMAIPLLLVSC